MDSSCGSKSKWALVHLCTCKAAANRSKVYVSGKKKKKKKKILCIISFVQKPNKEKNLSN